MQNITIESVNPNDLSNNEIKQIAEVEKDMWAYGIGEYVKCNNCGLIHSKDDIFGHLASDIKKESVTKLESIICGDSINCVACDSTNTNFIYDEKIYINDIIDRLLNSNMSYISILKNNEDGEIKGFMDGYESNLTTIFNREFKDHYEKIGIDTIGNSIKEKTGKDLPATFFTIATLGTVEKYKNLRLMLSIAKNFFSEIINLHSNKLLVELDYKSMVHSLYDLLGIKRMGFLNNKLINNSSDNYNSDLFLHNDIKNIINNISNVTMRDILKNSKGLN